jgi:hypothetical protein
MHGALAETAKSLNCIHTGKTPQVLHLCGENDIHRRTPGKTIITWGQE